ncbi:hypothetical protein SESBI_37837 [Sesbania bispinosa]|nr:hypothetical protein SESBI_37837 [Sesbania bispinosa]
MDPPDGVWKINVDAAQAGGGSWGIGILIRDQFGTVFAAAAQKIECIPDPGLAEAMGLDKPSVLHWIQILRKSSLNQITSK